jgi:hypothetical protein
MRNLDGWMDDKMNGWKKQPPPDILRILYIKIYITLVVWCCFVLCGYQCPLFLLLCLLWEHIGLDWCLLFFGRGRGVIIMHVNNILVSCCYYFVYVFVLLAGSNLKEYQSNPAKPTRASSGLWPGHIPIFNTSLLSRLKWKRPWKDGVVFLCIYTPP